MRALLVFLLAASLCSCSLNPFASKRPQKAPEDKDSVRITQYLDMGRPKAALAIIDDKIAADPEAYENYLTRNAVYLALRDYDSAMRDNDTALKTFEAKAQGYAEKDRTVRLARIHESFALTALLAADRAKDKDTRQRLEDEFRKHAKQVQDLDEETYRHLRAMLGDTKEK